MPVKYGKFEMPEKIKIDEASQTSTFTRFVVEPFDTSHTLIVSSALIRVSTDKPCC